MNKVKRLKPFSRGSDFETRVHVNEVIGRFGIEKNNWRKKILNK